jgi:hypothetical protein
MNRNERRAFCLEELGEGCPQRETRRRSVRVATSPPPRSVNTWRERGSSPGSGQHRSPSRPWHFAVSGFVSVLLCPLQWRGRTGISPVSVSRVRHQLSISCASLTGGILRRPAFLGNGFGELRFECSAFRLIFCARLVIGRGDLLEFLIERCELAHDGVRS